MLSKRFLLLAASFLLIFPLSVFPTDATEAETALAAMQKRYSSIETLFGSFRLHHMDFGREQLESGVFWLKKPAYMKWEYDRPEGQLFIADDSRSFFYVPQDNQVTVQSFNAADLRDTPLGFLLGSGNIQENFYVESEPASEAIIKETQIVRLIPKENNPDYAYLILEIDPATGDLRRLEMREHSGGTLEYMFLDLKADVQINNDIFEFTIPDDVEVLWIENE